MEITVEELTALIKGLGSSNEVIINKSQPAPVPIVSIAERNGEQYVRLCVGDVDILIEKHDLDYGQKFKWKEAMERLKEVGKITFDKHQAYFIAAFKDKINKKLKEIGGNPLKDYYWSSTKDNLNYAWYVKFSNGYINGYGGKYGTFTVRPAFTY